MNAGNDFRDDGPEGSFENRVDDRVGDRVDDRLDDRIPAAEHAAPVRRTVRMRTVVFALLLGLHATVIALARGTDLRVDGVAVATGALVVAGALLLLGAVGTVRRERRG